MIICGSVIPSASTHLTPSAATTPTAGLTTPSSTAAQTSSPPQPPKANCGNNSLTSQEDSHFAADTTGALVPYEQAESHSLVADVDPEAKELEKLKKKGKIINLIDGLNGTVSLAAFFLLMFVFNVSYAWLVFLAVPAIGAGARLLLRFDESEEDAYDKYQELAQKQRAQRLEQAAFKMQELENRNREGR